MSEFQLQIVVDGLLHLLGSTAQPQEIVDYLQRSISENAASGCSGVQLVEHSEVQNLIKKSPNPEPFLDKYNDLKEKNVDSLNNFVQLLNSISQDSGVKEMLAQSAETLACSKTANLTKDSLPELKNLLKDAVKQSPGGDPTSILNISSSTPISSTASMMSWVQRQPTMSQDFSTTACGAHGLVPVVPEVSQESILLEDLLNVLMGLPGNYILPEEVKDLYGPRTFRINDNVSVSLQEMVRQILPIASHYSMVQRFIEEKMRFEFGQVNNALAEAMQSLIKEHMLFTLQLETETRAGNMTLQKFWYYSQKNIPCLRLAADIAFFISKSDAKGGKVLSLLHDNVISSIGDESKQQLCLKLMEAACVPYMKMLGMWIYRGIITDPINEFLVEDNEVVQKEDMPVDYSAEYWDKKYSIRRERIPTFLESVSDIILKTGKYLNVIRQCGKLVKTTVYPTQYKIEEKHYMESIEKAYKFASQTLLDLVLKEENLLGRLKSVKHYFLLDKGDFIVTLLNLCEKELAKSVADVMQGRLGNLMDLALRLSSAVNDPFKDDLKTELLPFNLQHQMFKILSIQTNSEQEYRQMSNSESLSVIESFALSYEVRWPLSLILNRKALACYQMLFRHLFFSKYVERLLCQVWKSNKVAKKFHYQDAKHYREAFVLRQKMLHCVQNLEYHMMVEVIEPHWCHFVQKINKVQNVDEILSCHHDFLNACLKDCMLTIPAILSTVVTILNICVDFSRFMQNEMVLHPTLEDAMQHLSFKENIIRFDGLFLKAIRSLLAQINDLNRDTREHDRLFNLLYSFRLDYANSFKLMHKKKADLAKK